jgi:hypothetical protein
MPAVSRRSLIAAAAATTVAAPTLAAPADPLVGMCAEYRRLEAALNAAIVLSDYDEHDPAYISLDEAADALRASIAATVPVTVAGTLAQAQLLADELFRSNWNDNSDAEMLDRIIDGLERMQARHGGAVEV